MKKVFLFVVMALSIVACNNDKKKIEKLKGDVMDVHDRVMEASGEISNLMHRISEKTNDSIVNPALQQANDELSNAHHKMMDWMHDFKDIDEMADSTSEQVMNYLKVQKQKIQDVEDYTEKAIDDAKEALQNANTMAPSDSAMADTAN